MDLTFQSTYKSSRGRSASTLIEPVNLLFCKLLHEDIKQCYKEETPKSVRVNLFASYNFPKLERFLKLCGKLPVIEL